MTLTEDMLDRYVDGELDAASRAAVEAAAAQDPEVAEQLERRRALRAKLAAAFDPILTEPVPETLRGAVLAGRRPSAAVVDLAQARRARISPRPRPAWMPAATMAACLAAGVVIGIGLMSPQPPFVARGADGALVARGALAGALDKRLASDTGAGPVQVGLSFASTERRYCRTFTVSGAKGLAGLACRDPGGWGVRVLTATAAPQAGGYRQAASSIPPAVRDAAEALRSGDPLDARQEAAARAAGWKVK